MPVLGSSLLMTSERCSRRTASPLDPRRSTGSVWLLAVRPVMTVRKLTSKTTNQESTGEISSTVKQGQPTRTKTEAHRCPGSHRSPYAAVNPGPGWAGSSPRGTGVQLHGRSLAVRQPSAARRCRAPLPGAAGRVDRPAGTGRRRPTAAAQTPQRLLSGLALGALAPVLGLPGGGMADLHDRHQVQRMVQLAITSP